MESSDDSEEDFYEELSGLGEPTNSVTMDESLLNHEKDLLFEKTKAQESEIITLRLKMEAFEKQKLELEKASSSAFSQDDKVSMEREISALRGKVALLERNNKIFSNQERTELKKELERTKRRFKNLNEQLSSVRNSMEYDHINHVERALENFVKRVKALEKENNDLHKINIVAATGEESRQLIEEKEEIIKDQNVMIEELQHRINSMMSRTKDPKVEVPPVNLGMNEAKESTQSAEGSPRRIGVTPRSSSRRASRSRLSPSRSRVMYKDTDSTSSDSNGASDSDARAIRKMCGKMRQDIEEAKQKLRDMGEALDVPRHASPMHFPLRVYSSPVFETVDIGQKTAIRSYPLISPERRETRELKIPRMRSSSAEKITPRKEEDVDSDEETPVLRSTWPSDFYVGRIVRPVPSKTDRATQKRDILAAERRALHESLDFQEQRIKELKSHTRPENFMHLLCRYEFLRIRSLDHRLLEVEQECAREDYLKLLKLQSQRTRTKPESSGKVRSSSNTSTQGPDHPGRGPLHFHHTAEDVVKKDIKLSTSADKKGVLNQVPSVPRSYASTYALPENAHLCAAPYRVYIAKADYIPANDYPKNENIFSKIRLRIGDVATSLGAPETREDGKKYQLVEVNDKIGFVPLSRLQLAEEVHDPGRNRRVTRTYLTNTLRRIPDLYKRLHDTRRIMHCGV